MTTPNIITVCHFTSVHKPNDVRIFHKECRSLATAGYNVILVAPNCNTSTESGVHIIGVSANTNNRFLRMLVTTFKIYAVAKQQNAHIYHFHDPELLPFGFLLKLKGKKVIYDTHEDLPRQIAGKYWIKPWLRKIITPFVEAGENFFAKRMSYIITATPHIKQRFVKINHNCSDINNFPLLSELPKSTKWEEKKNEICYTGGITAIRGLEYIIDAMQYTNGISLNLAGNYSPESFRNNLASKPSWNKVNELGFVNRTELYEIYKKSKIGIVTFLPLPNHIDAQPNKMFEYMSAGIPLIASNFPLWKELVEPNMCGICVNPQNPKEIADAINTILKDDAKAKQMGENGQKLVIEKYNWKVEEEKLIEIYKAIEL